MKCCVQGTIRTKGPCVEEATVVDPRNGKGYCTECVKERNYVIQLGRAAEIGFNADQTFFQNEPLLPIPNSN